MQKSITISTPHLKYNTQGLKSALLHNNKQLRAEHNHSNKYIDKSRTHSNISIIELSLDEARDKINKQWADIYKEHDEKTSASREKWYSFTDRFERDSRVRTGKNRAIAKRDKVYHELVVAFGSSYDMRIIKSNPSLNDVRAHINEIDKLGNLDIGGDEWIRRTKALVDFANRFEDMYPEFITVGLTVHLDEANPHLHAIFTVKAPDESKRLKWSHDFNVAVSQIVNRCGYTDKVSNTIRNGNYSVFLNHVLKDELLKTYNKVNNTSVEKKEVGRHKHLSVGVYQETINNVANLGFQMFQLLNEMKNIKKKLDEDVANNEKMAKDIEQLAELVSDETKGSIDTLVDDVFTQKRKQEVDDLDELLKNMELSIQQMSDELNNFIL